MKLFTRWRVQRLLGVNNEGALQFRLNAIARAVFQRQEISPVEGRVWYTPGVQEYWNEEVAHRWVANATQGMGSVVLGVMRRSDALEKLARTIPKSAIVNVDDAHHILFYKLAE